MQFRGGRCPGSRLHAKGTPGGARNTPISLNFNDIPGWALPGSRLHPKGTPWGARNTSDSLGFLGIPYVSQGYPNGPHQIPPLNLPGASEGPPADSREPPADSREPPADPKGPRGARGGFQANRGGANGVPRKCALMCTYGNPRVEPGVLETHQIPWNSRCF